MISNYSAKFSTISVYVKVDSSKSPRSVRSLRPITCSSFTRMTVRPSQIVYVPGPMFKSSSQTAAATSTSSISLIRLGNSNADSRNFETTSPRKPVRSSHQRKADIISMSLTLVPGVRCLISFLLFPVSLY